MITITYIVVAQIVDRVLVDGVLNEQYVVNTRVSQNFIGALFPSLFLIDVDNCNAPAAEEMRRLGILTTQPTSLSVFAVADSPVGLSITKSAAT